MLTTFAAVDVLVVLHEIFTTDIYHLCFTSASDDKHTIINYIPPVETCHNIKKIIRCLYKFVLSPLLPGCQICVCEAFARAII